MVNQLLKQGVEEGIAIATGLKSARLSLKDKPAPMVNDKKKKYIED